MTSNAYLLIILIFSIFFSGYQILQARRTVCRKVHPEMSSRVQDPRLIRDRQHRPAEPTPVRSGQGRVRAEVRPECPDHLLLPLQVQRGRKKSGHPGPQPVAKEQRLLLRGHPALVRPSQSELRANQADGRTSEAKRR